MALGTALPLSLSLLPAAVSVMPATLKAAAMAVAKLVAFRAEVLTVAELPLANCSTASRVPVKTTLAKSTVTARETAAELRSKAGRWALSCTSASVTPASSITTLLPTWVA